MYNRDHGLELPRYADWAPTGFDQRGLHAGDLNRDGESDRSDWRVLPVIQTRDSEVLELSNFAAALEALGGEGESVEVHRFGHWGPGWFEVILVNPEDDGAITAAGEIACSLEDYPLLDEDDHSRREYEQALEQITDDCGRWVKDGAAEGWPGRIFSWLWKHNPRAVEAIGQPGGGGPSDKEYREALRALKLSVPKYRRLRVLGLREVRRGGFPPMYRDIQVREVHPEWPF